jgi:hypothetical protein
VGVVDVVAHHVVVIFDAREYGRAGGLGLVDFDPVLARKRIRQNEAVRLAGRVDERTADLILPVQRVRLRIRSLSSQLFVIPADVVIHPTMSPLPLMPDADEVSVAIVTAFKRLLTRCSS